MNTPREFNILEHVELMVSWRDAVKTASYRTLVYSCGKIGDDTPRRTKIKSTVLLTYCIEESVLNTNFVFLIGHSHLARNLYSFLWLPLILESHDEE